MKALSVKQPWANMIASGEKTIETRTWPTRYRGDLLIVSTRQPAIPPAGAAVCIVELYACVKMTREHEAAARCHYRRGTWSWKLRNVRPIEPFKVRGKLSLYEVTYPPQVQEALL